MSAARLTLVTGFFDLTRREPDFHRRTPAFFFHYGEFLLDLDHDIVFFVDPELEVEIRERRGARGLLGRTVVVPIPLEALPAWDLLPSIRDAWSRNPPLKAVPGKDMPLYVAMLWSKVDLLERALALDPFRATHFAWIDMGLTHLARTEHYAEDGVFANPADRARLMMRYNVTLEQVADRKTHYGTVRGHVAGGYFSMGRAILPRVCDVFRDEALTCLSMGIAARDEPVFAAVALRHPELFEYHYGNYDCILENYVRIRGSAEWLLGLMRACREQGDLRRANEIGERILASHHEGTFEATPEQLSALLEECSIAAVT